MEPFEIYEGLKTTAGNKMKICIPITNLTFEGNVVFDLAKELAKQGYKPKIIAPHAKGLLTKEKVKGVEIKRFRYFWPERFETLALENGITENLKANPLKYLLIPFFLIGFSLKIFFQARKSDVIHANWLPAGVASLPAKYLLGKPLVVTVHGADVRNRNKKIRGFFLKRFDAVTTGHNELFDIVKETVPEKTFLIRNAIDFDKLENALEKGQNKKKFGLEGKQVVSFIGRLADMKQPLVFIKAAGLVLEKRKDVKFLVLGNGPLKIPAEQLAKELGIEKNIIFTGRISNVFEYLTASDVFATVSHIENAFSVSLIEALLSGVPCIVSRAGTTEKFFTDKKNCLLVKPKSPEELAQAVLSLLNNKKMAKEIATNGTDLARKLGFSKKQILKKILFIYSELIKKKTKGTEKKTGF